MDYLQSPRDILVNVTNASSETTLIDAVKCGQFETVKKLVQAGIDVNQVDSNGKTPLHHSVFDYEIVNFLIQNGAEIDAVDHNGDTPLHDAVGRGHVVTTCTLLYYNADANHSNHEGYTPFLNAIIVFCSDAQYILLNYVDDFNAFTDVGSTTLELAFLCKSPCVAELIRRGANVNFDYLSYILDEDSAFRSSVRLQDAEVFKLVWEKLRYNSESDAVDLCFFFDILESENISINVREFVQVIIDSDNINLAVKTLTKNGNYSTFLHDCFIEALPLEQIEILTCRLLMHGYRANSDDLYKIFSFCGYCDLLKILLYMDIDSKFGWRPYKAAVRLIFDLDYELQVGDGNSEDMKWILQRFVYAPFMDQLAADCENEDVKRVLAGLSRVPSLIELARNASRKYIRSSFHVTTTCQFYTIIQHMCMPLVYKKILSLEQILYAIDL